MTLTRARTLRAAALAGFAVLLVAFGRHIAWRDAANAVRDADSRMLVLALLFNLTSLTLKGIRWSVLLRPLGVQSLSLVLRATFAGASLNNLVVAQGGEGARVLLVSRASGVPISRVATALGFERVLDLLSYVALLVTASWLLPLPDIITRWRMSASILLGAAVAVLVGFCIWSSTHAALPNARVSRLQRIGNSLRAFGTPARLSLAVALSAGAWALQVATYHSVAMAAHLDIPLAGSIAAMLAIGISFLVRATPGNVGVFQVIYAVTVAAFGIAEAPAVAVAVLIQMVQVIPVVALGSVLTPGILAGHGRQQQRL